MKEKHKKQKRAAATLFERFHGERPEAGQLRLTATTEPEVILSVGKLTGVMYKANGQDYIHEFHKTDQPDLFVSSDGQQIYVVAGRYVFTDRGFID